MVDTPAVRNLIREGKDQLYNTIQTGHAYGMQIVDRPH